MERELAALKHHDVNVPQPEASLQNLALEEMAARQPVDVQNGYVKNSYFAAPLLGAFGALPS